MRNKNETRSVGEVCDVFENGCYYLGDFETFYQCIQLGISDMFGKLEINENPLFVTHGEKSLKIEIYGWQQAYGQNRPVLSVFCDRAYFRKSDFSDCGGFAFDFYSCSEREMHVDFTVLGAGLQSIVSLTLHSGWNRISVSADELKRAGSYSGKRIDYFAFVFDRGEKHSARQTYYLDNFRAYKTQE